MVYESIFINEHKYDFMHGNKPKDCTTTWSYLIKSFALQSPSNIKSIRNDAHGSTMRHPVLEGFRWSKRFLFIRNEAVNSTFNLCCSSSYLQPQHP